MWVLPSMYHFNTELLIFFCANFLISVQMHSSLWFYSKITMIGIFPNLFCCLVCPACLTMYCNSLLRKTAHSSSGITILHALYSFRLPNITTYSFVTGKRCLLFMFNLLKLFRGCVQPIEYVTHHDKIKMI